MKWINFDPIILNYMKKLNSFKHILYVNFCFYDLIYLSILTRPHVEQMILLIVIHEVMMHH
jgi:hypothetical protein